MRFSVFAGLLFILSSCNSFIKVKNKLSGASPYESYSKSLEKAGLSNTALGQSWIRAGEDVFADSVVVTVPFTEAGYFDAATPDARSYRLQAKEGQVLTVKGTVKKKIQSRVFIDLFIRENSKDWKPVAFADSSLQIQYEFDRNAECLLRVQPELLVDIFFTISLTSTPVLINPVRGATNKSIGSFYGADRDGGNRKHEGIDIFAPKGTPVVAPADGYISNVGTSRLGGKVVWMYDNKRSNSYYFAHLDTQLVSVGRVKQGDTIGTVGNTGNARLTPPHLHFGIYQRGSKDPLHFIRQMENLVQQAEEDTSFEGNVFKVVSKKAYLHAGPGAEFNRTADLLKNQYVQVVGYNKNWYRVKLISDKEGYIARKLIKPASTGRKTSLASEKYLLKEASEAAVPVKKLEANQSVEVLAENDKYRFVRDSSGTTGWVVME